MLIVGSHISISGGFAEAALTAGKSYAANALQIFTKSPRSRMIKPVDPKDAEKFKEYCREYGIKFVVAHSSYLLNLAKPMTAAPWMEKDLLSDFERLDMLGGQGIVVHAGKSLDRPVEEALDELAVNIKEIIDASQKFPLKFIIENTAGQGTEIGSTLEQLESVWRQLAGFQQRTAFCLDTAHLWGAGYDLSTPEKVDSFFAEFDSKIGIKNLAMIHFNDSKKECGSRVDRHDNLGDGKIGGEGLKAIAIFAEKHSIPLILETPEKDGKTHLQDLKKVKEFFL